MEDALILVDSNDVEIGRAPKSECHRGDGMRHRAFSVVLFDGSGAVLIQERATAKPLWPGFWANSVCSHPRVGETLANAAPRRVREELGIHSPPLTKIYRFEYRAQFEDRGTEHELCTVFVGLLDRNTVLRPDPNEIAQWEWIDAETLDREMKNEARPFSPWFQLEWAELRSRYREEVTTAIHRETDE
ncbi:MAG: isopentenyl-diphosphate Delta-isomerase [Planctomycetota bacterium]